LNHQQLIFDTLHNLLAELGNRTLAVTLTSDLERDLGLGSLERMELIIRLEQGLSMKLPEGAFLRGQTPAALIEVIASCVAAAGPAAPATASAGRGVHGAAVASASASKPTAAADGPPAVAAGAPETCYIPSSIQTFVDLARYRAEVEGERTHLFLVGDDGGDRPLTFGEIWSRGLRVAAGLAERGVEPGDRVALILPTSAEFFTTFIGILAAGCVPVPLYPPVRLNDLPAYLERELHILHSAGARVLVTDRQLLQVGKLLKDRVPSLIAVASAELEQSEPISGVARVAPDDLALIQYSSGSTGDPKGVALSHRSLIANARAIGVGLSFSPRDIPVSWLPLYHDMGLIGTWLSPFLHGMQVAMLSPLQFLTRPERWLWAIHRYRGSISPAPNFAYDLCCRKIRDEDIEGLDLSSWRAAMNGSEPVRVETVERFCTRFARYGFRREAMMPVYGLAETSVALAFSPVLRGPRFDRIDADRFAREGRAVPTSGDGPALVFASCGRPLVGHELRVLDTSGATDEEVPERTQGRVVFRGPSSMSGYFGRPDATAAIRRGDWIDSGDLGYLADGELFVTGRSKDLIIKAGRKYHPQDIEAAIQSVEGIRKGCIVAFDIPDPATGEAIVVLAETHEPEEAHPALIQAVTAAVQWQIGAPPDRVSLLRPGSLPKTSSGKLRRRQARTLYLEGAFDAPSTKARQRIALAGMIAGSALRRGTALARGVGHQVTRAYSTAAGATTLVPGLALVSLLYRTPESTWRGGRKVLRAATTVAGLSVRRSGPPLPSGGAILVSNHASYLDWLALTLALEQPFLFTAKASVFELPILGRIVQRMGYIRVERGQLAGRQESYRAALDAARSSRLVHFFPEATFTAHSGLRPFRLGAFQLAAEAGLPIIPVAISGTRRALRDQQMLIERAPIEVKVLPAIPPPGLTLAEVARARDTVRAQLAREVGEPMLDLVTAGLPAGVTA
jgi:1-acyl-sn-glycerol-3-phosphate acyltransferase